MEEAKHPILTPRQLLKALKNKGFSVVKTRHSHKLLVGTDGRRIVVPVHRGRPIAPILLSKICKDISIEIDELLSET
ncbi:MAG: type II toxin-antitoxin system HicA family toxin [Ignavibacteria bacterium]|jgi:predicted RNA binding protein YcfA (HicA-like mRNA interferase family)|nr:type II toxin-antitoxin system HicA family toxin [Ignavibacteria bacterium]